MKSTRKTRVRIFLNKQLVERASLYNNCKLVGELWRLAENSGKFGEIDGIIIERGSFL